MRMAACFTSLIAKVVPSPAPLEGAAKCGEEAAEMPVLAAWMINNVADFAPAAVQTVVA